MTFYLEPPTGNISLQNVENYAFKRLEFLLKVYECDGDREKWAASLGVDDLMGSECLIEGTTKDQISHFILRLAMGLEPDTAKFFTQAEARLFDFRFQSMSKEELISFFRRVERRLQRIRKKLTYQSHWSEIISIVNMVKSDLGCWKAVIQMFKTSEKQRCFSVPFNIVPSLIAKRQVIVHKGTALVPYCYLDVVMSSLFKQTLLLGVKRVTAQRETTLQDPRIKILARRLQMKFRQHCKPHTDYKTTSSLSHDQVEEMLPWFPPCMSHLHHRLRKNHRLPHHSRQSVQGHKESGGCPFKHFDQRHLQDLLQKEKIEKSGDITQLALQGKYTEACKRFFEEKVKNALIFDGCVNKPDKTNTDVSGLSRKRKTEDIEEKYCSSTSAETRKNSSTDCRERCVNPRTLIKSHKVANLCLMTRVSPDEMSVTPQILDKTDDAIEPRNKEKVVHAVCENKAGAKIYRSESESHGRCKSITIGKCYSENRQENVLVNEVSFCSRPDDSKHKQKRDRHSTEEKEKKNFPVRWTDSCKVSSQPFINVMKYNSPSLKVKNSFGRKIHSGLCHTRSCRDLQKGHNSDSLFEGQGDLRNHKKCETNIPQVNQKCKKGRLNNCSMCRGVLTSVHCQEKRNEVIRIGDFEEAKDNNSDGIGIAGNNRVDDVDENSDDNYDSVDEDDVSCDVVVNDDCVDHDDNVDEVCGDDDENEEVYDVLDVFEKIHNDVDNIKCFDHDICPSQMCRTKTRQDSPARSDISKVQLQKPADYFFSFKELVQGLQQLNVKT